jgi:guanine deaminase
LLQWDNKFVSGKANHLMEHDHEKYIRMAMAQAEKGDTPFGAVVVQHGKVVATGYNSVSADRDPTAHSEINAIRAAIAELGTLNLEDCILYSNAEPCPMCMATILWSQIPQLVFGATIESLNDYVPVMRPSAREMAAASGRDIHVTSGVMEDLCLVPFRMLHQKHQR